MITARSLRTDSIPTGYRRGAHWSNSNAGMSGYYVIRDSDGRAAQVREDGRERDITAADIDDAIARGIIRECRRQDRAGETEARGTWLERIRGWRSAAAEAGDDAVVSAIDLLGERTAANVYAEAAWD